MTIARMKRGSTPVEAPTLLIAVDISAFSASLLSGAPNWEQEVDMIPYCAANLEKVC